MFKKSAKQHTGPVGGFAFYLSLLALIILSLICVPALLECFGPDSLIRICIFIGGFLVGMSIAHTLFRGHISVFFHEIKHSAFSNIVGNRAKGLRIGKDSGHFEYTYTKDTAHYNAMIALAPYWFPLFMFPTLIAMFCVSLPPRLEVCIVAVAAGADFLMNMRDIGPHQTDFSNIRGGYTAGMFYVVAINLVVTSILLSWVLNDISGLKAMGQEIWQMGVAITRMIKGNSFSPGLL